MKKLFFMLLALLAFGGIKTIVAKHQIHDANMLIANAESSGGTDRETSPSGKS